MAESLDTLLGNGISLISHDDIRYDGILFSIHAAESQIVLQKGDFRTTQNDNFVLPTIFKLAITTSSIMNSSQLRH